MIDAVMPDRFALEAFEAEQGNVQAAINRLLARHWTEEEAKVELNLCASFKGATPHASGTGSRHG